MKIDSITLFSTPLQLNGEDMFLPTMRENKNTTLAGYRLFLTNNYPHYIIEKVVSGLNKKMSANMSANFTISLPIDFYEACKYNYCCISSDEKNLFYFISPMAENNSIGTCKFSFVFDYWIDNCYEVFNGFKYLEVMKEKGHIPYLYKNITEQLVKIKDNARFLNTYDKPTIDNIIPLNDEFMPFDILWYDILVTKLFYSDDYVPEQDIYDNVHISELKTPQTFAKDFASTYHIFRPYKVYYKGTKIEPETYPEFRFKVKGINLDPTITYTSKFSYVGSLTFADDASTIANISLTFNCPIHYDYNYNTNIIDIDGYGAPISSSTIKGHIISSDDRWFIYNGNGWDNSRRYFNHTLKVDYTFNSNYLRDERLDDLTLTFNSPFNRYTNIGCFNLMFNGSIIPLYTDMYTDTITLTGAYIAKEEGAYVELVITDSLGRVLFNNNNLPLFLRKSGSIPYTVSQYDAYMAGNRNRIKANIIGTIASGAISLATAGMFISASGGTAASLMAPFGLLSESVGELSAPNISETPLLQGNVPYDDLDPYFKFAKSGGLSFNGGRATRAMNSMATFADLKNIANLVGYDSTNSMSDLYIQDRLLITRTEAISINDLNFISFCREYQYYGGVINRPTQFLAIMDELPHFAYIKTVDLELPLRSSFNRSISNIFNRGVRLWHTVDNSLVLSFNKMIENYERNYPEV